MSSNRSAQGNWTAGPDDLEEWMQLIDWETLDWILDVSASATQNGPHMGSVQRLLASTGSTDSALLHGQSTQECHNVYDTTLMLDPHRVESSEIRQPAHGVAVPNQTLSFTRLGLQGDGRKRHPLVYTEVHNNNNQAITAIASRNRSVNRGNRAGLKCNIASCNYEGTFPRQWELQRHVDAKHKDEKPYWCPVIGCIKGRGAPAFARSDKLTAHIRAVHLRGSAQAVCPASTCANTALELDLLGVHVKLQHLKNKNKYEGVIGGFLRAITNAVSSDHRLCPLWFCKVRVKLDDFPSHLLTHTSDEIDAAAYELAEEGYIATKFGCEHGKEDIASSVEWCTCKVTSIEPTCPLCGSRHGTRQNLKTHIERSHVRPGEDMMLVEHQAKLDSDALQCYSSRTLVYLHESIDCSFMFPRAALEDSTPLLCIRP